MKQFAPALLLLLGLTLPVRARAQIAADIIRGQSEYQKSQMEAAKNTFATIIASRQQVKNEDRVIAYKYLGAYWALQSSPGARDSASSFFRAALDFDPFTDLDRTIFAADEQNAFARAKLEIFKIGLGPIRSKVIDTRSTKPEESIYTFSVVSTHIARTVAEIRKVGNADMKHTFPTITNHDGIREFQWDGLINSQRADTGLYEFVVTANDNIIRATPPAVETQRFRVEHVYSPLEDTLPDFRNVAAGGTDTLRSRYSRALPYTDAAKGLFLGSVAGALPFVAFNRLNRTAMSGWASHWGVGISLGAIAGIGAATYATSHRDDANAARENARRRNLRAQFNADVIARNKARLDKTILVIRPLTSAGTGN